MSDYKEIFANLPLYQVGIYERAFFELVTDSDGGFNLEKQLHVFSFVSDFDLIFDHEFNINNRNDCARVAFLCYYRLEELARKSVVGKKV